MKTVIFLSDDGTTQINFTPENDNEKRALSFLNSKDLVEVAIHDQTNFLDSGHKPFTHSIQECKAGYLRAFSGGDSKTLVIKPRKEEKKDSEKLHETLTNESSIDTSHLPERINRQRLNEFIEKLHDENFTHNGPFVDELLRFFSDLMNLFHGENRHKTLFQEHPLIGEKPIQEMNVLNVSSIASECLRMLRNWKDFRITDADGTIIHHKIEDANTFKVVHDFLRKLSLNLKEK